MEDEQRKILDGIIIDVTNLSSEKRKKIISSSGIIINKFPGDQPLSFKWINEDPFAQEEVLHIATCDDGLVDENNINLYEYIYELMHSST